jgi:phage baseplate assembly protein V
VSRLRNMIARGIVLAVKDTPAMQELKVSLLAGETREGVKRFQQYGFTSHPLDGAEQLTLDLGGDRDQLVVISVDDRRYRLKTLSQGEVALYTDEGDSIELKRGGIVVVKSNNIRLGSASASDEVARKSDLQALADAFNGHSHAFGSIACSTGTISGETADGPSHTATGSPKVKAD